jgi:hypothetical protein
LAYNCGEKRAEPTRRYDAYVVLSTNGSGRRVIPAGEAVIEDGGGCTCERDLYIYYYIKGSDRGEEEPRGRGNEKAKKKKKGQAMPSFYTPIVKSCSIPGVTLAMNFRKTTRY